MRRLINGDCLGYLSTTDQVYDCIFADPPDNLGLDYNGYVDKRFDYYAWLVKIIELGVSHSKVFWLSYYHKHDVAIKHILYGTSWSVRTFIWRFEFGQYREGDSPNGYRPIVRVHRGRWKPNMDERVPSLREKIGDLRATGRGRVPDDVWEFSRVQGNAAERRAWHPTQHNESVYRRIIRMSLPVVNGRRTGTFLDMFAGSGTCFRCTWDDMQTTGVEISPFYCKELSDEHHIPIEVL
jgi:DNA modification methylase